MHVYRTGPVTERLALRALTVEDAEAFFALNSNPQVMRFTGEPPLTSLEEAREAIVRYPDFDTVGYGRWGCVLRSEQRVIGFCGLKYLADLDAVDVGYSFRLNTGAAGCRRRPAARVCSLDSTSCSSTGSSGWCSPKMLRRFGCSKRSACARTVWWITRGSGRCGTL